VRIGATIGLVEVVEAGERGTAPAVELLAAAGFVRASEDVAAGPPPDTVVLYALDGAGGRGTGDPVGVLLGSTVMDILVDDLEWARAGLVQYIAVRPDMRRRHVGTELLRGYLLRFDDLRVVDVVLPPGPTDRLLAFYGPFGFAPLPTDPHVLRLVLPSRHLDV